MRFPFLTIIVSIFVLALFILTGPIPEGLIWQQGGSAQYWRWVSGHFVHISLAHLAWNMIALLILGTIIEQTSKIVLSISAVIGIVGVNIYLASFYSLYAYAGLSGVLNSLLVLALYFMSKKPGYGLASLMTFVLSASKILFEYHFNVSMFAGLPWPSVPQAHFFGFVSGVLFATYLECRHRRLIRKVSFGYPA